MYYTINLSQDRTKVSPYISNSLLKMMERNLLDGKKCILYLNRRGEYSSLVCKDCQFLYKCSRCDTSFAVHRDNTLMCHLCWLQKNIPIHCENCNGQNLLKVWVGTQQIEEILRTCFPKNSIYRLDFDSLKNTNDKKLALQQMERAQIIIGTKMITTWYDIKGIGLIGIVLLEQELMIPQYDIEERVLTVVKQVIWRSREKEVDIIVQTFIPDHPFTKSITEENLKEFFQKALEERRDYNLPPFSEIAILEYRSIDKTKWELFITWLCNKLEVFNKEKKYEIISNKSTKKRYNQYYSQIYVKWNNIHDLLENVRWEIVKNWHLTVSFP